jgi:hypothetical protein
MKIRSHIFVWALVLLPVVATSTEPVCEFKDPERRRISGDNPSDFSCIKLRAESGDEFQQFYLGLILIGQVPGPTNVEEGLAFLKQVAKRNGKYSANAMISIGETYKRSHSSIQNYEEAYQWLYLASQQPLFKETGFPLPDKQLNSVLTLDQRKELERNAHNLLQER